MRRRTRFRVTAPPTFRLTTRPTHVPSGEVLGAARTTTAPRAAERPSLETRRKSAAERSDGSGPMKKHAMPRALDGPWHGDGKESLVPLGYAYADESHESWPACGCSADKSASPIDSSITHLTRRDAPPRVTNPHIAAVYRRRVPQGCTPSPWAHFAPTIVGNLKEPRQSITRAALLQAPLRLR